MSAEAYALLALSADTLDDLEKARIAAENRLRHMTRDEVDADGGVRDLGLSQDVPEVRALAAVVDGLQQLEHQAMLALRRTLRAHPLGPWVRCTLGIGEKQGARLLASVGDPYWHSLYDRPRTVSELWAYTGNHVLPARSHDGTGSHDPAAAGRDKTAGSGAQGSHDAHGAPGVAPSRARGQRANWSDTAKMRAHLVAISCIKCTGSPYRTVYDKARRKYAEAKHATDCRRCGPAGRPALVGSDLSDGHKHARALRLVAKAVLRDLWRESRRLYGMTDDDAEVEAA